MNQKIICETFEQNKMLLLFVIIHYKIDFDSTPFSSLYDTRIHVLNDLLFAWRWKQHCIDLFELDMQMLLYLHDESM